MASTSANPQTVPITLRTSSPTSSFSIPNVPYLIPSNWKRSHLSTLVNRLLNSTTTAGDQDEVTTTTIPFDFIIDGNLLTGTIENYLKLKGESGESTLDIQYLPSTMPPKYQASFEQDDWISQVDANVDGLFLTSSYDSTFRIFSSSNTASPLHTFSTNNSISSNPSLTSISWLNQSQSSSRIVTGGMDGLLRIFQIEGSLENHSMDLDLDSGKNVSGERFKTNLIWTGLSSKSSDTITSISTSNSKSNENSKYLLSSSTDGSISLFDLSNLSSSSNSFIQPEFKPHNPLADPEESEEEIEIQDERSRKKRKLKKSLSKKVIEISRNHSKPLMTVWHVQPSLVNVWNSTKGSETVGGRNSRVSKVIFGKQLGGEEDEEACLESSFSSGWDGCVREWDWKDGGRAKGSKSSEKTLLCMDQLLPTNSGAATLVTGNMDRSISVWDMRSSTTNISLHLPSAHTHPVSTIRCHPTSSHLFSSGSHDGAVKIWDIRSSKQALFSLSSENFETNGKESNGKKVKKNGKIEGVGGKVLTMDWTKDGQTIVCGGEDKKLKVWRGEGIGKKMM